MIEGLTRAEYDALLRNDFALFAARCFHDLNPQAELAMNWHLEVIAAKLAAVRDGEIPPADHQPATASSEILAGLDRLSGVVSGARPVGSDPVRQLCPGSFRQARPRLPQHCDEPVVSTDLPDPPGVGPPGGAGIRHHPPGLSARHL